MCADIFYWVVLVDFFFRRPSKHALAYLLEVGQQCILNVALCVHEGGAVRVQGGRYYVAQTDGEIRVFSLKAYTTGISENDVGRSSDEYVTV